jgi:nucleoside-diphosphate-sugar epimerase
MNILILGGSGYLGSVIANYLCNYHNVIVGTRNIKKISVYNKKIKRIKVDYNSFQSIKKCLNKIEVVFHLVGMNKNNSNKNPIKSLSLKKKVTSYIVKAAEHNKCKIIYFSSIQVYKNFNNKKFITEKSKVSITNAYSKAHLAAEKKLLMNKNINIIILRLSSVFGAKKITSSKELIFTLINNFCYQASKKKLIFILNPNIIRNFLPSTILIKVINYFLNHKNDSKIINIGYKSFSLYSISKIIKDRYEYIFKKKCEVRFKLERKKNLKKLNYKSNFINLKFEKNIFIQEIDNLLKLFNKKI